MKRKQQQRQNTPSSYRLIHSKNNQSSKRISTYQNEPNNEYFPNKPMIKQTQNLYMDVSRTTSNKQWSQTSKTFTRASGYSNTMKQEQRGLEKEVKSLKKQLQKYHKMQIQRQDKNATLKKVEQQLVQAYRALEFYESKVKQMESYCKLYEQTLNEEEIKRKGKEPKISQIIQEHRNYNIELSIQLDKKDKLLEDMNRKLGNLQLKKVENQYKIKQLTKQLNDQKKKKQIKTVRNRFIDDYEQEHLMAGSSQNLPKKRLNLSRQKRTVKLTSGESSGQEQNDYRSIFFMKKKPRITAVASDRQSSVRSLGKANIFGNLNSKLNLIEKEVLTLKNQNQRLHSELDQRVEQIIKLKSINHELEIKLSLIKETTSKQFQEPKKILIQRNMLKQIPKPSPLNRTVPQPEAVVPPSSANTKLSQFVSNISRSNISSIMSFPQPSQQIRQPPKGKEGKKTNYKIFSIQPDTLTKIIVNVIKTELTHDELVNTIAECWSSQEPDSLAQELELVSCELKPKQLKELQQEYKEILNYISSKDREQAKKDLSQQQYKQYLYVQIKNVLLDIIPPYKNITFRRQFTINIQLANKFKNYEPEFLILAEKYENKMPLPVFTSEVKQKWGLSLQQFMCMLIKSNEEYGGTIDYIQFQELGNFYLQD